MAYWTERGCLTGDGGVELPEVTGEEGKGMEASTEEEK